MLETATDCFPHLRDLVRDRGILMVYQHNQHNQHNSVRHKHSLLPNLCVKH